MENQARLFKWSAIPYEQLSAHIERRFVHGESIMLAQLRLARGAIVPLHSHHNEQVSYILEGALKFWIGAEDGEEIVVGAGKCSTSLLISPIERKPWRIVSRWTSSVPRERIGSTATTRISEDRAGLPGTGNRLPVTGYRFLVWGTGNR